jgi:hypothetical protein
VCNQPLFENLDGDTAAAVYHIQTPLKKHIERTIMEINRHGSEAGLWMLTKRNLKQEVIRGRNKIRSFAAYYIVNFLLREINVSVNKTCVSNTDAATNRFNGLHLRLNNLFLNVFLS